MLDKCSDTELETSAFGRLQGGPKEDILPRSHVIIRKTKQNNCKGPVLVFVNLTH